MVELGLYAVLRIHVVVFSQTFALHAGRLRAILLVLGIVTVVVGGIMCYAEHHLKRLLAFSTICHAGLMLVLLALRTPAAIAGLLLYLLAHALVKSSLFFCSGIILHRLRTISEPKLFARGKPLRWTALVWFLGGAGLAAAPPFATMLGDLWSSRAGDALGLPWLPALFILGGALTGGAVLRVGARIFLGWGDHAITDTAARVDELPETKDDDETIFWYHFFPAALCIAAAACIAFVPAIATNAMLAAMRLNGSAAYIHTVYSGVTNPLPAQHFSELGFGAAALHGLLALGAAGLLAATSVFRLRLPRRLRIGAYLEGSLTRLRALQSGHPGDYVMWLTVGAAGIGLAFLTLLR